MKKIKLLCLCICLGSALHSPMAQALGKSVPSNGTTTPGNNTMETFLLNLGIFYAKSNPQVAPILLALNINTADDLRKFISGDASGSNIQDIITNAIFQKAFTDPKYAPWFKQLGVTDFASLKALLSGSSGANKDLLLNLAFNYLDSNPNYQVWLSTLGINDASDLQDLLSGGGQGTNIQSVILSFAMVYAQSHPNYAPYIFLIGALLGQNTVTVDMDHPLLGAYQGLSATEIQRIQTAKKKH